MSKQEKLFAEGVDLDLDEFNSIDEADMTVMHPVTGEPTTWVITFAGPGHPKTVAQTNRMVRERLKEQADQEQARINGRRWKSEDRSPDEERERNVRWISERILRWTPVRINGDDYPCTSDNAKKLLMDPRKGTLFQQCLDFLISERTFTKRSATT